MCQFFNPTDEDKSTVEPVRMRFIYMSYQQSKIGKYSAYLELTEKQRLARLEQARHQEHELDDPHGSLAFPDINFVHFQVRQRQNDILLCTYRYPAAKKARAVVLMIHGLNSHLNQGAHLAHQLANHDIETVGFDHRGFGRSQGEPGYMDNFETHIEDCLKFIELIKPYYKDLPLFCLGQSMGGLTAYRLSLQQPNLFQGVIMMAPALKKNISKFVVGLIRTLKFLLPEHMKMTNFPLDRSCRNRVMVQKKQEDSYYYKQRFSLATVNSLLSAMSSNRETYKSYRCPFLLVQGGMDRSVDPAEGFRLFQQSPLDEEDKDILFYQGMWHDIWYEPEIDEIIKQTLIWIDNRLKRGKVSYKTQNPEKQ